MSAPVREITTTCAPRPRSTDCTVTDAPPLPSTSAFLPAGFTPLRRSMYVKPNTSVLSPKSVPSGRRTMVLTLPSALAASDSWSRKGTTAFL